VPERSERESAYFALLRAREELSDLRRYSEHLDDELRRLRRAEREEAALRASVSARVRRIMRASDAELEEVMERRSSLIEDERHRLPARIAAAEAFVAECEHHHDVLGGA
jgi:translation initiation factor 2B subunit (eIF-2B alpha/beta/delta family)